MSALVSRLLLPLLVVLCLGLCGCGGDELGPQALGRFRLDRPAMERMYVQDLGLDPEHARKESRAIRLEVAFQGDQTFQMRSQTVGRKVEQAQGTWALDGTALTLKTTHENGRKLDPPRVEHGQFEDPVLSIVPPASMKYRLILRRAP